MLPIQQDSNLQAGNVFPIRKSDIFHVLIEQIMTHYQWYPFALSEGFHLLLSNFSLLCSSLRRSYAFKVEVPWEPLELQHGDQIFERNIFFSFGSRFTPRDRFNEIHLLSISQLWEVDQQLLARSWSTHLYTFLNLMDWTSVGQSCPVNWRRINSLTLLCFIFSNLSTIDISVED